jgi:hypothetical protein
MEMSIQAFERKLSEALTSPDVLPANRTQAAFFREYGAHLWALKISGQSYADLAELIAASGLILTSSQVKSSLNFYKPRDQEVKVKAFARKCMQRKSWIHRELPVDEADHPTQANRDSTALPESAFETDEAEKAKSATRPAARPRVNRQDESGNASVSRPAKPDHEPAARPPRPERLAAGLKAEKFEATSALGLSVANTEVPEKVQPAPIGAPILVQSEPPRQTIQAQPLPSARPPQAERLKLPGVVMGLQVDRVEMYERIRDGYDESSHVDGKPPFEWVIEACALNAHNGKGSTAFVVLRNGQRLVLTGDDQARILCGLKTSL